MPHHAFLMARQYRVRTLTICLSGSKTPPSDLCISGSHHLNLHIDIIPRTPPTSPTTHFRWPGNTEPVCSVSVSQGQKPQPPPDLCILASYHLNPHIDI